MISSFEARSYLFQLSKSNKCSRDLFKLIVFHCWALVLIRCERCTLAWLGFTSKCQIQHLNLVEQKQLQSQGHSVKLNSTDFLKAWPFNVIEWLNENLAKICKISTSFILIYPLASHEGWKIDGLHNSEMHLFDLDLRFGLKIQGNTSSLFFSTSLKARLQEHIFE